MSVILTLNAGSSSIKFSVYNDGLERMAEGQVENLGSAARLIVKAQEKSVQEIGPADHGGALGAILKAIEPLLDGKEVAGVGHRVVHGGTTYDAPAVLTEGVIEDLKTLNQLAPLHQPHNLSMVEAARAAFPSAVQVGCFDTAFHRGHPWVADTFGLPRRFFDEGVRRYGFHGLSYDYISGRLARDWPDLKAGRVIVAHLGNGASMCAVQNGRSMGSSMGFSALDGLAMGTRCGQLDPGVILYLLDHGYSAADISDILYKESGLKGLSGLSNDMRALLDSQAPEAREAIDYYVSRIRRELGALTAVLGGLDGLVFCGGVGENAAPIRAEVVAGMAYLGLDLDTEANAAGATEIGRGPVRILVIPTDEEVVIARAVASQL